MVYKYSQGGKKTIDPINGVYKSTIQCYKTKKNGKGYTKQNMEDFKHHHESIKKKLEDMGAKNISFLARVMLPVGMKTFKEHDFYNGKIEDYYEGAVREVPQLTNEIFQIEFSVTYSL